MGAVAVAVVNVAGVVQGKPDMPAGRWVACAVLAVLCTLVFAALGVRVTLIDARAQLLPFVDREIMDALVYHLRANRATLHLGEKVSSVEASSPSWNVSIVCASCSCSLACFDWLMSCIASAERFCIWST